MTTQVISNSPERTIDLAASLTGHLRSGDLIALDGPLGSGKTCFVRGLARGLSIDEREVSSPTFVIRTEYEPRPDSGPGLTLVHLDAYRLSDSSELDEIGWSELLEADGVVIAVEWAERIVTALPTDRIRVTMGHIDEQTREITIDAPRGLVDEIEAARPGPNDDRCPVCEGAVSRTSDTFPFCSSRCRYVDLGNWLDGSHRITRPVSSDDLED